MDLLSSKMNTEVSTLNITVSSNRLLTGYGWPDNWYILQTSYIGGLLFVFMSFEVDHQASKSIHLLTIIWF